MHLPCDMLSLLVRTDPLIMYEGSESNHLSNQSHPNQAPCNFSALAPGAAHYHLNPGPSPPDCTVNAIHNALVLSYKHLLPSGGGHVHAPTSSLRVADTTGARRMLGLARSERLLLEGVLLLLRRQSINLLARSQQTAVVLFLQLGTDLV